MLRFLLVFLLIAQSPYYAPKPLPRFDAPPITNTIQIQVQIYDESTLGGAKVEKVSFNHQQIPLQPPDLHKFRGTAGFRLSPGTYDLIWTVTTDRTSQPKPVQRKEKVSVSKADEWIQITIEGEKMTLS